MTHLRHGLPIFAGMHNAALERPDIHALVGGSRGCGGVAGRLRGASAGSCCR